MDLSDIKLLGKGELFQKLKQCGFIEVLGILEDKDVNGEKLIGLKEFEIFKWKLSQPQKACLWDCIKKIKANPSILLMKENPKQQIKENSSFSQNGKTANLFKGKLEGLLGGAGASVGSTSTLPNRRTTNVNKASRDSENSISGYETPPPPSNRPKINQHVTNKQGPKIIKKPARPLPDEIENEERDGGESGDFAKPDSPDITETYMDMQPPIKTRDADEVDDDGYLNPTELSEPEPNFKNFRRLPPKSNSFSKKNIGKNTSVPPPPPLPNKGINIPKKNSFKVNKSRSPTSSAQKNSFSGQTNLPRRNLSETENPAKNAPNFKNLSSFRQKNNFGKKDTGKDTSVPAPPPPPSRSINIPKKNSFNEIKSKTENRNEEDDTYEAPPKVGSVKNVLRAPSNSKPTRNHTNHDVPNLNWGPQTVPTGANSKIINTNKFSVEVVADETEEETNYESVDNKERSFKKTNDNNRYLQFPNHDESDDTYEPPPSIKPKIIHNRTKKNPEINKTNTQNITNECALHSKKPTATEMENVSIVTEKELTQGPVSKITSTLTNILRSKNKSKNAYENHGIISQKIGAGSTIMSIRNRPLPKAPIGNTEQSMGPKVTREPFPKPPLRETAQVTEYQSEYVDLVEHLNVHPKFAPTVTSFIPQQNEETYENVPEKTGRGIVSHFSSQRRQKSLPIGNGKFANIKPTSNVSDNIEQEELNEYGNTINQDNLVLLLTKELRQRNLQQEAEEQSSFTDTDFEDEDNDQPLYDNTSSPIDMTRNTSRIGQERHDDEQDQPVYDNTPTLQFNNNTSANLDADEEISEDVDIPSYKNIEDSIRIFKRPLPDIPKNINISVNNAFKNTPMLEKKLLIKNKDITTPPSTDEENQGDENITYSNTEESKLTFKRPPPVTDIQILNKPSKVDKIITQIAPNGRQNEPIEGFKKPLPKPPIAKIRPLNYEHVVKVKENTQDKGTDSKDEEDEDYINTIFNINDEPYYRNTDRKGAKLLLRNLEDGAFLFRPSKAYFLVLTVKHNGKFYNLGIERSSSNKIRLNAEGDNMPPEFATLNDFVKHFIKKPVTFRDKDIIVEIYLKTILPVGLH